jgi:sugar phosphate isomerase/epimerase
MSTMTRRRWIGTAAVALSAPGWFALQRACAGPLAPAGCTLSIGTYSFKGVPLEKAIGLVAEIGYDAIEIATQPGFDGHPDTMPAERRQAVRRLLKQSGLKLTSLMEHLYPAAQDRQHAEDLRRLRRVAELGHDLAPDAPPLVQTVLGGGEWEQRKALFRDRLGDWAALGRDMQTVIAVKPHRGNALSRPDEAVWLIRQLDDTPWLRMVYDYSHYAFRDMSMESTIATALPYTAHLVVKDVVEKDGRAVFLLPGESGTVDYATLLRLFHQGGYRGDVCCEVSSMISAKSGYDPAAAAKTCYHNLARAFADSAVPRRRTPSM